jgi:hypothetical protein
VPTGATEQLSVAALFEGYALDVSSWHIGIAMDSAPSITKPSARWPSDTGETSHARRGDAEIQLSEIAEMAVVARTGADPPTLP